MKTVTAFALCFRGTDDNIIEKKILFNSFPNLLCLRGSCMFQSETTVDLCITQV